ncbi:MAG TPA: hypothetical protein VJ385_11745 [Fibrobacteria bacterium]|nr:hypothetical protein [Fibrobacteria bacterium]
MKTLPSLPLRFLLAAVLTTCTVEDPSGPTAWTVSGRVVLKPDATADFSGGRIRIGGFPHNEQAFAPALEDIRPRAGVATVGTDRDFTLGLDARDVKAPFIHVAAWLDLDGDTLLDASSEPFTMVREQNSFGGTPMTYAYDKREETWLAAYDDRRVADLNGLEAVLTRSLSGSPVTWTLRGKVRPDSGYKLRLDSGRAMLGAFSGSSARFIPDLKGLKAEPGSGIINSDSGLLPEAGRASLAADSSFSLRLEVGEVDAAFIHLILWYDADGDRRLEPLTEHFSVLAFPSLTGTEFVAYQFDPATGQWLQTRDREPATGQEGLDVLIKQNISPILKQWRVSGKLAPEKPFEINFASKSLRVGAFSHLQKLGSQKKEPAFPDLGRDSIRADSGFSLAVDASSLTSGGIQVITWLDQNGNDSLEQASEPYTGLLYPTAASKANLAYAYDSTVKDWRVAGTGDAVGDLKDVAFLAARNLIAAKNTWTLSGTIRPKAGFDILYGSKTRLGVFANKSLFFNPEFDDIKPEGGISALLPDSGYAIKVKTEGVSGNYLHLFVWYDADGDGLMDALKEPFSKPYRPSLSENAFMYYTYNGSLDEYRDTDTEKTAQDSSGQNFLLARNILPFRDAWTIKGSLVPLRNQVMHLDSGTIRMGAFYYQSASYRASVENIVPDAGSAVVGKDSSFTLGVNGKNIDKAFIHLIAWFDQDNDNRLDAASEAFDQVLEEVLFGGQKAYYQYKAKNLQWESHYDGKPAADYADMKCFIQKDLRRTP